MPQYDSNGLKQPELLAEYLMAVMPEAIAHVFLLRTIWLITMPKALFVPYDKRNKAEQSVAEEDGQETSTMVGSEEAARKESRATAV